MSSVAINFTLLICDGVNRTLLQRIRDAGFKKMQFPGRLLRTLTCITDRTFYIRDMYLIRTKPQIIQSWHVCLSECTLCISHITCIECIHDSRWHFTRRYYRWPERYREIDSPNILTVIKTGRWYVQRHTNERNQLYSINLIILTAVCARLFYEQMNWDRMHESWKFS